MLAQTMNGSIFWSKLWLSAAKHVHIPNLELPITTIVRVYSTYCPKYILFPIKISINGHYILDFPVHAAASFELPEWECPW